MAGSGGSVGAVAVGTVAAGSVLVWSGLKGASILATLQSVIQGKKPSGANVHSVATPATTATAPGATTETPGPGGTATVDGVVVAGWFAPLIAYAKAHGWSGTVTSGYRSAADQARVCSTGVQPCAAPGSSHHQGLAYPDGAIDVTPSGSAPQAFVLAVRGSGLQGASEIQAAGSKDPVHISIPGSHRAGEGTY
ncbi:MAG: hypothetical protein ACRDNK_04255 [Solirubrobacteraceae bacterium]